MAISQPTGYPVSSAPSSAPYSITSPTTQQIGDYLVLFLCTLNNANTITSVSDSAGQVSSWTIYETNVGGVYFYAVSGKVTANGGVATTITPTWGTTNTTFTELTLYCLHSGLSSSTNWSVVAEGLTSNTSSTTVNYPTLVSNSVTLQAYVGYSLLDNSYAAGATPSGFTAWATTDSNVGIYDLALATSTSYSPTGTQSPAGAASAIGVIISVTTIIPFLQGNMFLWF